MLQYDSDQYQGKYIYFRTGCFLKVVQQPGLGNHLLIVASSNGVYNGRLETDVSDLFGVEHAQLTVTIEDRTLFLYKDDCLHQTIAGADEKWALIELE